MRHGWNAVAYQILNPGICLWFSSSGDAVAGYARFGHVRIVAGAPVCPPDRLLDAAVELEADAIAQGERVVFFGAGERLERVYAARVDHALVRIGAQPTWEPNAWPTIVRFSGVLGFLTTSCLPRMVSSAADAIVAPRSSENRMRVI